MSKTKKAVKKKVKKVKKVGEKKVTKKATPETKGMKKKVKKDWLAALRGGKYIQGTGKLCQVGAKRSSNKYCCLGVLSDLYLKSKGKRMTQKIGNDSYPSNDVVKWSGIKNHNPMVPYKAKWGSSKNSLSHLNDSENLNFDEIADLIEKHL